MHVQNATVETPQQETPQENAQQQRAPTKRPQMKALMIKRGEFTMSNSLVLPAADMCLIGEPGTILVPLPNVLPILGVGNNTETKCSKCGYTLAMGVEKPQVQNVAVKCPNCGELNEL